MSLLKFIFPPNLPFLLKHIKVTYEENNKLIWKSDFSVHKYIPIIKCSSTNTQL